MLRRISYTLLTGALLVIVCIVIIQFTSGRRAGLSGAADVAGLALVLLIAALPVALQAVSTTTMALAARRLAEDDGVIVTKLTCIQDLAWYGISAFFFEISLALTRRNQHDNVVLRQGEREREKEG